MHNITDLVMNPSALSLMSNEDVYTMPGAEVEELQQRLLRRRFAELRPKIKVVARLSEDLGITTPDTPENIASLSLPHTFYKSYTASDVEKSRFDRMTRWLGTLTSVDLSDVDTSGCNSIESWLNALKAQTILRPLCSSGTSGKSSFFPRTTVEEPYYIRNFLVFTSGFRDEPDSGLAKGDTDFLTPWPFATGNHNLTTIFRLLREHAYAGRNGEHVHILGTAHWNIDTMWLAARLRAAEAKADRPAIAALTSQLAELQRDAVLDKDLDARNVDSFIHELTVNQRGKKICLFAPPREFYALVLECEKRGIKPQLSPDSFIFVPGSATAKGGTMPDGWVERCKLTFPFAYQSAFGMTESTGGARLCAADHYHLPPWIYLSQLDPDTSQPYPRTGLRTGRLALFDLLVETHWGGAITGDRVTIDWDSGCSCGRLGPFIHNDITRYGSLKDDDKITCARTADAYEKAVEFILGSTVTE